ncbi:MAG: alcohol dehydrogenase [Candidatus Hydrogenedentota bacterium]|nr:MAG: alcohol dehydrogenase [Candidatus Hydrogenedentota bacterium]
MKALRFETESILVDIPMPRPAHGEALIRVHRAGICNTDLEICNGYMGFQGILGHEFVGTVVHATVNHDLEGQRVVGEINCVCHRCDFCKMEMPNHCRDRTVLGILNRPGAFAEYVTLPEENLHIVPEGMDDNVAVFTEPTAAVFRIPEQITIDKDDKIVVLGAGKLGQLISQVLYSKSKNLVAVGRNRWKLEILKEKGIPTGHVDDPMELSHWDIVVDATGSYAGFTRALELVRPEGTVVLKTTVTHPTAFDMSTPVVNEVRIIGSRCGPYRPALDALDAGTVEVRSLISETYDLKDAVHAIQRAANKDVMKVLIHMPEN